jgi:hypothetical protein
MRLHVGTSSVAVCLAIAIGRYSTAPTSTATSCIHTRNASCRHPAHLRDVRLRLRIEANRHGADERKGNLADTVCPPRPNEGAARYGMVAVHCRSYPRARPVPRCARLEPLAETSRHIVGPSEARATSRVGLDLLRSPTAAHRGRAVVEACPVATTLDRGQGAAFRRWTPVGSPTEERQSKSAGGAGDLCPLWRWIDCRDERTQARTNPGVRVCSPSHERQLRERPADANGGSR